ncbi:hypothetical protein LEP1GSC133_3343 [Leptospira borgpetersenii serovar Pomona str. 200901868]|uniref:Uncharacterized protein n=1 Tax=Leptospira borgpetersenii serovar Pomona str. 200901868 TaxID=1192866 RepID=M6VVC8_LEPBO|nr:hypothetical protein LEP1GSC133_3343 [Leptospira borgpetersenii serovar Pomona str. 200901868]
MIFYEVLGQFKVKCLECVPKPFDLIGILADYCNCSYVLGQTLI